MLDVASGIVYPLGCTMWRRIKLFYRLMRPYPSCIMASSISATIVRRMIGFSDHVDLWVINIKKPTILCAPSTSSSGEQSAKRRSRCENM